MATITAAMLSAQKNWKVLKFSLILEIGLVMPLAAIFWLLACSHENGIYKRTLIAWYLCQAVGNAIVLVGLLMLRRQSRSSTELRSL